ncbi:MAG: RHS repeat-associated core domain-containing protein, partial [Acidimicrobiia bacterium]
LLTGATGSASGSVSYDPYGAITSSAGTLSRIGYAGEYTDAETGFVYLRARYYDPGTGQFLSRDPIEAQTRSAYGYVGGNPLNGTDPSGLDSRHSSKEETVFCFMYGAATCGKVGSVIALAQQLTRSYIGVDDIGAPFTPGDALYHIIGSALLTVALGDRIADAALRAHEGVVLNDSLASAASRQDTCNDLRNNAIGKGLGQTLRAKGKKGRD